MKKDIRKIETLKPYDKNPRGIDKKNFALLKKHIKKYGQFKPIIINQYGIILGGNMRYRAYLELDITDVWVSQVETKSEAEIIEYNLIDNQRYGYYEEDALAELAHGFKDVLDLKDFQVDLSMPAGLDELLSRFNPEQYPDSFSLPDGEKAPFQQMTFTLADTQAEEIKEALKKAKEITGLETYGNENSNGNALYWIIKQWVELKK